VSLRRPRLIRVVTEPGATEDVPFATTGRPPAKRKPILWIAAMLRVLTLAWSAAIVAALVNEFGPGAKLPFLIAMAMTGLLVGATFLWTARQDDRTPEQRVLDDDGENDLLTDLPTFNYFSRRLGDEFARSRRMGRHIAIVLIDVNNLTAVNKEYGVRAGDEVLRHVARAVDGTRRYHDIVARLGDDEFGVLLLDTAEAGVAAFIERLEDRLARESASADVAGRMVSLWAGVSSGSAVSLPEMTRAETVLEAAMNSLDESKQERERRRRMWLAA
jgi:diguanylate cyclase (GGDEF)-like protein